MRIAMTKESVLINEHLMSLAEGNSNFNSAFLSVMVLSEIFDVGQLMFESSPVMWPVGFTVEEAMEMDIESCL